jgi:hypothetical protein
MDARDKARSDLYLAQLRTQTAPNTPGFGPLSPSYNAAKSPRFPQSAHFDSIDTAEKGEFEPGTRFVEKPMSQRPAKPFALQPPPIKVHPASPKTTFQPQFNFAVPAPPAAYAPAKPVNSSEPAPMAAGETQYAAVPIPGAYQPASPPPQQTQFQFGSMTMPVPGQAVTSERRIASPPSSPRLGQAGLRR